MAEGLKFRRVTLGRAEKSWKEWEVLLRAVEESSEGLVSEYGETESSCKWLRRESIACEMPKTQQETAWEVLKW